MVRGGIIADIEIIKSLLHDGEHTYGITIWMILAFLGVFGAMIYFYGRYKMAFGRRRLIRRLITRGTLSTRVKFPVYGEVSDMVMVNAVKESLVLAVGEFDKEVGISE